MLLLDRIFVADRSHPLPVGGDESKGTWRLVGDDWVPIERSSVVFDSNTYVTVVLATSYMDWTNWQLSSIPGLGTLSLETFWGDQGAWITLCELEPDESVRTFFLEANLESVKVSAETPRPSTVYDEDDLKVEEVLVAAAADANDDQNQKETSSSDNEGDQMERQRTPYDLVESDIEMEDLCSDVPLEREWLRPPAELVLSPLSPQGSPSGAADVARVTQIEMALDAPDVGPLRRCLSGDLAAMDEEEESQDQLEHDRPTSVSRRLSKRFVASLSLPWYLRTSGGQVWWCISVEGWPLCWRRDHQISRLCEAVEPGKAKLLRSGNSVQDMEMTRRRATKLLSQLDPALLDEFIRMDVALPRLLASTSGGWVGVVESEGRIVERKVSVTEARTTDAVLRAGAEVVSKSAVLRQAAETARRGSLQLPAFSSNDEVPLALRWKSDTGSRSFFDRPQAYFTEDILLELSLASVSRTVIAGAPAVAVTIPQRQFVFVTRSTEEADKWAASLKASPSPTNTPAATASPWKDRLRRWPLNRLVCNDFELCLDVCKDPLSLSAELLRLAISAQGSPPDKLFAVTQLSCKLKTVDLTPLDPQDLWGFWVNVYHSLLVHSCGLYGRPRTLRSLLGFYNSCSYVVAGQIFSLAEIEHLVLRSQMQKASTRLMTLLVRVWRREPSELEERPSLRAPRNPGENFRCRPDWRLNLVLCAGNKASSSKVPVFEHMSADDFDKLVSKSMSHCLRAAGRLDKKPVQLPYVLYRFRADAPGPATESPDRRWSSALSPLLEDTSIEGRLAYKSGYDWTMRERLDLL